MNLKNNLLLYVTFVTSVEEARQVNLLIESLRKFGGRLGDYPVWIFFTDMKFSEGFSDLGEIKLLHLEMDTIFREYPLADKVIACAQAEEMAALAGVETLVWLNPDCLIFNPPELFVLDDHYDAAFRPVHIRNVGSLASEPLDGYWQSIYQVVKVDNIPYAVESFVDGQTIHPYLNTHCFAIHPALGILQAWRAYFSTLLLDKEFQENFCKDALHRIFLHQAVLSALVMKLIDQKKILWLPPEYSYPLHLQERLPVSKRVQTLNQLVCMVYEEDTLLDGIEIQEPILSWLRMKRQDSDEV